MNEQICGNCASWSPYDVVDGSTGKASGECRRESPRIVFGMYTTLSNEDRARAVWPLTLIDEWCGDYCDKIQQGGEQ